MATIRDVARQAGVSVATVSAVINNSKPVSPELTQRVHEAIAALKYRPNLVARALYTKRTSSLALVVPSIANPFFSSLLKAVEDAAHRFGYSVFVGSTDGDPSKVEFYRERLLAMGIDGLLTVLSWDITSSGIIEAFQAQQIPVVGVAGSRTIDGIDCYVSDDIMAGQQAARYLTGLGHRHIAFLGTVESQTTALRYEGVCLALKELGLSLDNRYLVQVNGYDEAHAVQAVSELVTRNVPFTAVIAFNDVMALGALGALQDQGYVIPDQVSVLGFDDTVSRYSRPRMTTVACPKHLLGEQGAARLLARIQGDTAAPMIYRLPTELIVRESTRRVDR